MVSKFLVGRVILLLLTALALVSCTAAPSQGDRTASSAAPVPAPVQAPPQVPSNLEVEAASADTVAVRWLDNSDNEQGYRVYRDNILVGKVGANVQEYQVTGLQQGATYTFTVKSYNTAGESLAATCVVTTSAPPSAPANVQADATSASTVIVRWLDNSSDEDGFRVYRGSHLVGDVPANVQTFPDTGLQQGTTYMYAVKAFNQAGESQATMCSVVTPAPPSAPSNLSVASITQSSARLSWSDTSDNELGFRVYRNAAVIATVGPNSNTYSDTGLQSATQYRWTVVAHNEVGDSPSLAVAARTLNPPITVRLDRIGVYDNGEIFLRDLNGGEVYIGIVVTDGNTHQEWRLPATEGGFYTLYDNDVKDLGQTVFSVDQVGDHLRIAVVGYEDDGGTGETLLTQALGMAIGAYMGGADTLLGGIAGSGGFGNILARLIGASDEFLGSYENAWRQESNWGIGTYADISCNNGQSRDILRLWFTISSP